MDKETINNEPYTKQIEEILDDVWTVAITLEEAKYKLARVCRDYTSTSERLINKHIPDSFYAGLSPEERLKMLVKKWQRGVEVVGELEEQLLELQANVDEKAGPYES